MRERITSVESLKQVVPLTEQLYAVARETAQLEHENFLLAQEQAVKSEAKAVLDSWVRFEQQQREKEQGDLVRSVREGIEGRLGDRAFRQQLLEEALGQVEREFSFGSRHTRAAPIDSMGVARRATAGTGWAVS